MQREYSLKERTKRFWTHKPYRRAIICVSGVQAFGQLTGFNTLLYYSGTIFGLLGLSNPAAASLIPAGGNALFLVSRIFHSPPWLLFYKIQFIGMLVVDRFGRRRLLVTFIPGMIAGLVWVTVTFVFMTRATGNQLDASVTYEMKYVGNVLGALILFTCSFGLTYSHIVWYQSEFLALEIRAAGSAIATTACWVANLIVSISFLSMLNTMTPMGVYGFYLGFITVGYVFVHLCYPETSEFIHH
jgi:SP family myo-inositol transporter-like MFS transporter 13